jgi:uncharacterized protein (DUF433 family)
LEDRIVIDPRIGGGKPVIRRTGTPVATVVGRLASGTTFEQIQRAYDLTAEDIRAALAAAARWIEGGNGLEKPDPGCFHDVLPIKTLSARDKKALRRLLTGEQFDALMDIAGSGGPDVDAIARIRAQSMT